MGAVDKIMMAEEAVSHLQGQLSVVEDVLDSAEEIVVKGRKAGRCFRRLFRLLLLIAIVAAVVAVIKKVVGDRSLNDEEILVDAEIAEEAIEDAVAQEEADAEEQGETS